LSDESESESEPDRPSLCAMAPILWLEATAAALGARPSLVALLGMTRSGAGRKGREGREGSWEAAYLVKWTGNTPRIRVPCPLQDCKP